MYEQELKELIALNDAWGKSTQPTNREEYNNAVLTAQAAIGAWATKHIETILSAFRDADNGRQQLLTQFACSAPPRPDWFQPADRKWTVCTWEYLYKKFDGVPADMRGEVIAHLKNVCDAFTIKRGLVAFPGAEDLLPIEVATIEAWQAEANRLQLENNASDYRAQQDRREIDARWRWHFAQMMLDVMPAPQSPDSMPTPGEAL